MLRSTCSDVSEIIGSAAASRNVVLSGFLAKVVSSTTACVAYAPIDKPCIPYTASPTPKRFARGPTAMTSPDRSCPSTFGQRGLSTSLLRPSRIFQSTGLTAA